MSEYEVVYREPDDNLSGVTIEAASAERAYELFYEYDYPGVATFVMNTDDSDDCFDPFED